jgi:hypothetical protein
MGTLFKVLIVGLIILGLTAAGGLAIMAVVANTHDVKSVPVPKASSLYTISTMWSYADAFRRPMDFNSYHDLKQMEANITIKGDGEVHRSANEVVYAGHLPGIDYQVGYLLDRSGFPSAIEIVTVYKLKNAEGRYLWKVFRPIHRCLAPYMLDKLGSRAPS